VVSAMAGRTLRVIARRSGTKLASIRLRAANTRDCGLVRIDVRAVRHLPFRQRNIQSLTDPLDMDSRTRRDEHSVLVKR